MKNTRTLVFAALFVVLEVIFSQYLGLTLPTMRFSFTFAVMAICGYFFGWKMGMMIAVIADLIGMVLYPKGPFFIGFTIASGLAGAFHGLLYQKEGKDLTRWIVIVTILNVGVTHILVNSYSLTFITDLPIMTLMIPRLIKAVIELPLTIIVLMIIMKQITKIKNRFSI